MADEQTRDSADLGSPPPRWVLKTMTRLHVFLHRLTGGRLFNTLQGDEVCFVGMTGARSGRSLTFPLMYVPYREGLLLVASQGGAPKNPSWYHNLVKHSDIVVNLPRPPDGAPRATRRSPREGRTVADLRRTTTPPTPNTASARRETFPYSCASRRRRSRLVRQRS